MKRKYFADEVEYFTENKTDSAVSSESKKELELPELEKEYIVLNENLYRVHRAKRRIIGHVSKQD